MINIELNEISKTLTSDKVDLPSLSVFKKFNNYVKWCTPSILPEVKEEYNCMLEGSVSISGPGKLQDNTGVFKEIHNLAAKAYNNENGHSHFSCEGTTGANRVLFDLIRQIFDKNGKKKVLSTRNVHQSIVVNATKNRVPIEYLKTRFDENNGIFLPPTVDDVLEAIDEDIGVVLLSNPTYEGLSCDLLKIVERVKLIDSSILIYIDEAWGGHFAFSNQLPMSGTEAGADFVVQSLHKQGGAPNPSNIIHLSQRVVESYYEDFIKSYTDNLSTTYSYPLIAAMEHTRKIMQFEGGKRINELIIKANYFKKKVIEIAGLKLFETVDVDGIYYDFDKTKVNLDVSQTGLTGDYIAKTLEQNYGVITEKEELNSICLIMTFEISIKDILYTLYALNEIISNFGRETISFTNSLKLPEKLNKKLETYEVDDCLKTKVLLTESVDCVIGENIKCYPPGIYIAQKGEVINEELKDFLIHQRGRSHVYADDKELIYITVLDNKKNGRKYNE